MVNINYNILYFFIAAPVIEWSGKIGNLQCRNRHNIDSESLFVLWDSLDPVSHGLTVTNLMACYVSVLVVAV